MKAIITGGAGFLGARLARAVLDKGTLKDGSGHDQPVSELVLIDVTEPAPIADARVTRVTGDISDPSLLQSAIDGSAGAVFHLAAIVSGMAESDFDLGMRINVDATRALLELCRAAGNRPRVVFTSSVAVFGGELPQLLNDTTALNPQTSYGIEKAIGEFLIADYTRKGFIDGRSLRLPTITVLPGRPNAAASSFASGIIREPLSGEDAICPVGPDAGIWVASPRTAIAGLLRANELPSDALGNRRWVNIPGISVTAGEMASSLERIAGPDIAKRIRWERNERIERMVLGWPPAIDNTRAIDLGFQIDKNFDSIIRAYMEEDMPVTAIRQGR
jgi:D-erythronate 2-dehydrogenase